MNTEKESISKYWPTVYSLIDEHKKNNNNDIKVLPWNKCSLSYLSIDHTIGMIRIEFDKTTGRLIISNPRDTLPFLSKSKSNSNTNSIQQYIVPFGHPHTCPFNALMKSNSKIHHDLQLSIKKDIKVGVSVLIEDVFGRVFLTKRAKTMRIFPSLWVLPGGHMEKGESFIETGLRELKEETGLDITDVDIEVFGAYESTYPQLLEDDRLPGDHHFVAYTKIKLHKDISQIQKVVLSPDEVDVACWIPLSTIASLLSNKAKDYELENHNYNDLINNNDDDDQSNDFESFYPDQTQQQQQQQKDLNLKQSFLNENEILTQGTVFILKQYLHSHTKNK